MTIELDEEDGTYRARIDWSEDIDPSVAVVHAVLAASDRDEDDLAPLITVVDGDALDNLFDHAAARTSDSDVRVTFRYEGYEVTLDGTSVSLRPVA